MELLPLLFLGLVVAGGAVVLRYLIRLKRAALEALEAAKALEGRLESLQAQTRSQSQAPGEGDAQQG